MELSTLAALAVGILVALIWAATLLHGLWSGDYVGAQYATPIMLIAAGYLFGVRVIRKAANGNGK